MSDCRLSLIRLLQTSDSAFPSGAFAFSSGLETLAREGKAASEAALSDIITGQVLARWFSFDRCFLRQAMEAAVQPGALLALDLRCHLQNSAERLALSSRRVGRSLLSVHSRIGTPLAGAYQQEIRRAGRHDRAGYEPVVQGVIAAGLGLDHAEAEVGALHAVTSAFLSAAVRLGVLGAIGAQAVMARIAPVMAAGLAAPCPGHATGFAPLIEIASARRSEDHANLFAT